jgi:hypothetical protein
MMQMEYLRIRKKENANINEIRIKGRSILTSSRFVNQVDL